MRHILPLFILLIIALRLNAQEICPDGHVKYDITNSTYIYGEHPDYNNFGVLIQSNGEEIEWEVKRGCYITEICVSTTEGLVWPEPVESGSWQGGYHIVFWGGCQVPYLSPRSYIPLVIIR